LIPLSAFPLAATFFILPQGETGQAANNTAHKLNGTHFTLVVRIVVKLCCFSFHIIIAFKRLQTTLSKFTPRLFIYVLHGFTEHYISRRSSLRAHVDDN
jgi:hypothetical protein